VKRYDGWLMLADRYRFSGSLVDLMRLMTHREFKARLEWIKQEKEREVDCPSLTDHYLMKIAAEVRRSWVKDPQVVDMQHMKLVNRKQQEVPVTKEEAAERAKSRWCAWLNVKR
jgi:hypothetical protein